MSFLSVMCREVLDGCTGAGTTLQQPADADNDS